MVGLLVFLYIIVGAGSVGVVAVVGMMVLSGQWTLPNSETRRVQRAKVARDIASFKDEEEAFLFKRSQTEANRLLLEAKTTAELEDLQSARFRQQLELEAGSEDGN